MYRSNIDVYITEMVQSDSANSISLVFNLAEILEVADDEK